MLVLTLLRGLNLAAIKVKHKAGVITLGISCLVNLTTH